MIIGQTPGTAEMTGGETIGIITEIKIDMMNQEGEIMMTEETTEGTTEGTTEETTGEMTVGTTGETKEEITAKMKEEKMTEDPIGMRTLT